MQDTLGFWRGKISPTLKKELELLPDTLVYAHLFRTYLAHRNSHKVIEIRAIIVSNCNDLLVNDYGWVKKANILIEYCSGTILEGCVLWHRQRNEFIWIWGYNFQFVPIYLDSQKIQLMSTEYRRGTGSFTCFVFRKGQFVPMMSVMDDETPLFYLNSTTSCKRYQQDRLQFYNQDMDGDGILDFGFKGVLLDYCGKFRQRQEEDSIPIAQYPISFYYLSRRDKDNAFFFLPVFAREVTRALADDWVGDPFTGKNVLEED